MKTLIKTLLILLLLGGECFGASIERTVCSSGCTDTTLKSAIDHIRTNGDGSSRNTITISAGTYSSSNDYALIDNANLTNLTIQGAGKETTTISPSGTNCISVTNAGGTGLIVNDLTLSPATVTNAGLLCSNLASTTVEFNDCDFIAPSAYEWMLVYNQGITTNFNRCGFFHQYDTVNYRNPIRFLNDADGTFNYCHSAASGFTKTTTLISIESTGTVNFNNCTLFDSQSHGISFSGAGVFSISNSIVTGGIANATGYPVIRSNGALTLTNNYIFANWLNGDSHWISGAYTDGGGNVLTNTAYKPTSYQRDGIVVFRVDDVGALTTSGWQYATTIAPLLEAKGMTGVYCAETINIDTDAERNGIRALVSGGIFEVAVHTRTHSDLGLANATKLFDVTKAAETITIDRTADTITLSGGGSVSGFKSKSLATIKTELEALGATVTGTAQYNATASTGTINGLCLGEALAAGTATNQLDLLVDDTAATGLFKTEMVDAKATLETIINGAGNITDPQTGSTYVCRTLALPYNSQSVATRTAAIAAGFVTCHGGPPSATNATFKWMGDIDLFSVQSLSYTGIAAGTEAATRQNARAVAFAVAQNGIIVDLLTHSTSEMTVDQVTWLLEELDDYNVRVMSAQQFADYVMDSGNGWMDDGDGTYSREFTNATTQNQLQSSSPCINAGTKAGTVGLTGIQTDAFDNTWDFTPYDRLNIGADQTYSDADLRPTGVGNILNGEF